MRMQLMIDQGCFGIAVKVALLSARDKSPNLIPVILLGEAHGSANAATQSNIDWFREHGGIVYRHNLTFRADIQVWPSALLTCMCIHHHLTCV